MNLKAILSGAISGALGGLVVDVKIYFGRTNAEAPFDWGLALSRIVQGAIGGAVAAAGLGAV